MTSTIITALVGLFCTLVSSFVTFLFTRKKYNEEVTSQRLDNLDKAFTLSQKMYKATTEIQNEKIQKLQEENDKLKKEFWDLQQKIAELLPFVCNNTNCPRRTLNPAKAANDNNAEVEK